MNSLLDSLKNKTNFGYTENGAIKHNTTRSNLLDMFAMGASMRKRSDNDVILMFKKAFEEDETYALKCLFYIRDTRGGAGERRFFRVCMRWLANEHPEAVARNLEHFSEYGRYDDYYCLVDTPLEDEMFRFLKLHFMLDLNCKTPSLLGKWLKSVNCSSYNSRMLGQKTAKAFGLTQREYRKSLATLRARINVLERLMSENRWEDIQFDAIPSRAGLIYRNAFARRDIIREKYERFAKDKNTTVNADVLNPVDIANKIFNHGRWDPNHYSTERLMLQKYWDNLKDYYNGREERGIAVVDVSGSMTGQPMNAAVSMGAYIAERGEGTFKNHFITFSAHPKLVEFKGVDITDKFLRAREADWGYNTNIQAVFDLLLRTAQKNHVPQSEMPERVYIFSDMEFDSGTELNNEDEAKTLMERIAIQWRNAGYKLPSLIFWNLNSRSENIPAIGEGFSYVSGFSMNMIESILSGKDGFSLMIDKLDSDRYKPIH